MSMCVAWIEPDERLSRMAAQLAPFRHLRIDAVFPEETFFVGDDDRGESVSAIIPNSPRALRAHRSHGRRRTPTSASRGRTTGRRANAGGSAREKLAAVNSWTAG